MAILLFAVSSSSEFVDAVNPLELHFRQADDGRIELLAEDVRLVGYVPPAWEDRIRATARHKSAPRAYLWCCAVVDDEVRAVIVVATAGASIANVGKNPALMAEVGRLMEPCAPLPVAQGAWAAHGAPGEKVGPSNTYPVGIVGESNYQPAIRRCREGQRVYLALEPDNPYDADAIAVETERGALIGYIGRDNFLQEVVHSQGLAPEARILSIQGNSGRLGVVLDVSLDGHGPLRTRSYRGTDSLSVSVRTAPKQKKPSKLELQIYGWIALGILLFIGKCMS